MITRHRNRWLEATPNGVASQESPESRWYATKNRLRNLAGHVDELVAIHPVASLAVAISAGVVLALWMKRR